MHAPVAQSPPALQVEPTPHLEQEPPQSLSVSVPFLTLSSQVAARHVSPTQTPVTQSRGSTQASPTMQGVQVPPQSVPVSLPFLMVSLHAGAAQASLTQRR